MEHPLPRIGIHDEGANKHPATDMNMSLSPFDLQEQLGSGIYSEVQCQSTKVPEMKK